MKPITECRCWIGFWSVISFFELCFMIDSAAHHFVFTTGFALAFVTYSASRVLLAWDRLDANKAKAAAK